MTRIVKYDWEAIEREYIYDSSPGRGISLTLLAQKHGMGGRSDISERALKGRWYERRKEFRSMLGEKTVEALTEKWVEFETARREKTMTVALAAMDRFQKDFESGEVKITPRDFIAFSQLLRQLSMDAAAARQPGEGELLSEDTPIAPDQLRRAIRLLEEGELNGADPEPGDAAEEPPPAVGED